jgi:hypothetical protein
MDIRDMHYDFKVKFNKLDSQQNKNLKVQEIDWKLTEAQEIFIKAIAEPRYRQGLGFELNQRSIDDIKSIVKKQFFENGTCTRLDKIDDYTYKGQLPEDYLFYTSSRIIASKGICLHKELIGHVVQDDDLHQETWSSVPSFEWRETNLLFSKDSFIPGWGEVHVKSDGTFVPEFICLHYIMQPPRLHNAQDVPGGSYMLPNGTTLTGSQSCILPKHVHGEIVDLAVLLATTDLISEYNVKQAKTALSD